MNRQQGVSLPAALVAVALTAIVGTAITRMITDGMAIQKHVEFRQAGNNLRLSILRHLSDPLVCAANFGLGSPGGPVNPTTNGPNRDRIRNINGTSFLEEFPIANVTYMNGTVRVIAIDFSLTKGFSPNFIGSNKGASDLVIRLQSTLLPDSVELGQSFRPIRLVAEVAGGLIQRCVAVGDDEENFWRLSASGDVFFPNPAPGINFVGVGTNNPLSRLHVNGSLRISNLPPAVPIPPPSRLDVFRLDNTNGTLAVETDMIAETYMHGSDKRLKQDVELAGGLSRLRKLQAWSFRWKSNLRTALGLKAQEVEKVFPSVVQTDEVTKIKTVDYSQLQGPLIESVKELAIQQSDVHQKINKYEMRLLNLKKRLSKKHGWDLRD